MALADLLRAIEADAGAERARADRETAAETAAIVERARREAAALAAELAATPEAQAHEAAEEARALARMHASGSIRSAREEAFVVVLEGVRERLAALRGTEAYPGLFGALLAESRAALPSARVLRVDRRDLDIAIPLARGLGLEATLDTCGGVELVGDDGRTIRNTLEERLSNAEILLRRRFAHRLEAMTETLAAAGP
jgi:vacuolar-type H+-ATPase subunit E/Vma4